MSPTQQELRHLAALASQFLSFALAWIGYGAAWLRESLAHAGVPRAMQTAILLAILVLLAVTALRALGGLLRLALLVAAGLLVARALGVI